MVMVPKDSSIVVEIHNALWNYNAVEHSAHAYEVIPPKECATLWVSNAASSSPVLSPRSFTLGPEKQHENNPPLCAGFLFFRLYLFPLDSDDGISELLPPTKVVRAGCSDHTPPGSRYAPCTETPAVPLLVCVCMLGSGESCRVASDPDTRCTDWLGV